MTPIQVDRQSFGMHDISIPHDVTPIGDIAAAFPSNDIQTTAANAAEAEVARETQIANESNQGSLTICHSTFYIANFFSFQYFLSERT